MMVRFLTSGYVNSLPRPLLGKLSAGEYWKEYNNIPRTDKLSTLTPTYQTGVIDYWGSLITENWLANEYELKLPFEGMWQKRLTFASHKVIIKNAADVHQQAPNIAEANKYTATVGDVPFTVTFPTPLQCRGNTPIGFSSDVIFGTDTDYLSTINVYTGTYDFDPKDVGVFGLRHRFSTIVSYSGTTETNASYMNVTYVQVKVEPASYVHASQNPAACPETIYPAYLTSASQSNTLFIFGAAVVDSATGDYVVFGRLWT